jgi:hypothetical protein
VRVAGAAWRGPPGYAPAVPDAGWTRQARDVALLEQLERRRYAYDQSQWQAPVLTIAAQAFLLQVLADEGLECVARGFVLAAGLLATWAAGLSLRWMRKREREYSERIEALAARIGMEDPRPRKPKRLPVIHWRFPLIFWWALALAAFFLADIAVFFAAL